MGASKDRYPEFKELGGANKDRPSDTSLDPWGRLYDFKTGHSQLSVNHMNWIRAELVPTIEKYGSDLHVQLWGYASKRGHGHFDNEGLSRDRANEVKKFIVSQVKSGAALANVRTGYYGDSVSTGGPNDNSPLFRGVDVYIRLVKGPVPPPPPPVKPPVIKPQKKMYIGPGVKGGGFLALGGAQVLEAHLYSVDSYSDQFNADCQIWNAGLGLGGGLNLVMAIAYGGYRPSDFYGCKFGGIDFNVSIGGRWGDFFKEVKMFPSMVRIARALKDSKMTMQAAKALLKLTPSEWEQMSNLSKAIRDALNADSESAKPQFNNFDVPMAGAALELDVFYSWGSVETIY